MIVAAGGGERDYAADAAILSALPAAADPGALLNERLMSDLRPTLFLAQLSNLLAGNISLVHGVVGSSRTLMGEEACGADAVRVACARIAAGQGDLLLVGGSYQCRAAGRAAALRDGRAEPQAAVSPGSCGSGRAAGGGLVLGSVGCFLVIESRAHAAARGAAPVARHRRRGDGSLPPAVRARRPQNAARQLSGFAAPSLRRRWIAGGRGGIRRLGRADADPGGAGLAARAGPAGAGGGDGAWPLAGSRRFPPAWRWRRWRWPGGACSGRWNRTRRRWPGRCARRW